jgi:hypothetical protein
MLWCCSFFIDSTNRHEHLYEKIYENVIESSMFSDDVVSVNRLLLRSRVILCTLSMLSNGKLGTFTRLVPVELVVVDEASQIEIGDYLPMLSRFQTTLRKLVFIGDDKQCSYLHIICSRWFNLRHEGFYSGALWAR